MRFFFFFKVLFLSTKFSNSESKFVYSDLLSFKMPSRCRLRIPDGPFLDETCRVVDLTIFPKINAAPLIFLECFFFLFQKILTFTLNFSHKPWFAVPSPSAPCVSTYCGIFSFYFCLIYIIWQGAYLPGKHHDLQ